MSETTINKKLAMLGGPKVIEQPFRRYNSIGEEEVGAAKEVVESGVLSQFLGCWDPDFYGGPKVQQFERECETFFSVKYAVSVNSATSGLIAALGAIGIEPGDEVIVSPWTMCASATAILHWNAIPVFADIDRETFNLDPKSIEATITPYTKAIMSVDIFGQSADMEAIMLIAKKYNLKVISDSAQSPGVSYKGKYAGTLADVGCYSLNYHKHIHTGEGGICLTDDSSLAERMQLIRNHAEAVVENKGVQDLTNMIGFNFRLGEIEAAIEVLERAGTPRAKFTVLHCTTEYPTPMDDVNLKAMTTIADAFKIDVGYSDHTLGIEVDIAAVAMGAKVIEKHFTLDKTMTGPDHQASLEPDELKAMVQAIRNIEKALGTGIKKPSPSESKNIAIARKSIVAKKDIKQGDVFSEENLAIKRPGNGVNPMRWDEVIGQVAQKDYSADELI